ncbi:MAG: hypothetical protein V4692_13090 [Bdellovibrionota bacterium]
MMSRKLVLATLAFFWLSAEAYASLNEASSSQPGLERRPTVICQKGEYPDRKDSVAAFIQITPGAPREYVVTYQIEVTDKEGYMQTREGVADTKQCYIEEETPNSNGEAEVKFVLCRSAGSSMFIGPKTVEEFRIEPASDGLFKVKFERVQVTMKEGKSGLDALESKSTIIEPDVLNTGFKCLTIPTLRPMIHPMPN